MSVSDTEAAEKAAEEATMSKRTRPADILALGLGNRIMTDDAVGPLTIDLLAADPAIDPLAADPTVGLRTLDGGSIGMALLPEIEAAEALIVIDAMRFGGAPGDVKLFEGAAMDRVLGGVKRTAHEAALADLASAAALRGAWPALRALVGVEPADVSLGMAPSPAVAGSVALAAEAARAIAARWRGGMAAEGDPA